MNITIASVNECIYLYDDHIFAQLKESLLNINEDKQVQTRQVFNENTLNHINNITTSNKQQLELKDKLIKLFEDLNNDDIFICAKVIIQYRTDKAIPFLTRYTELINESTSHEHSINIAHYEIGDGFSIGHYFNKPFDFSTMFTNEGYEYYTYMSQRYTHANLNIMQFFEQYLQDDVYLKYETIKIPAQDPHIANWDFCIVLHAITKEQKQEVEQFEKEINT